MSTVIAEYEYLKRVDQGMSVPDSYLYSYFVIESRFKKEPSTSTAIAKCENGGADNLFLRAAFR